MNFSSMRCSTGGLSRAFTHLVVGENSEDVQLRVWSETLTLPHASDHSCYERAVAQT